MGAFVVRETPPGSSPRLLDQVRSAIRTRNYSELSLQGHPLTMGRNEIAAFRRVSASTQTQALSAILFLYRNVLRQEVGWIADIVRAKRPRRVPVVLARDEVRAILGSVAPWAANSVSSCRRQRCVHDTTQQRVGPDGHAACFSKRRARGSTTALGEPEGPQVMKPATWPVRKVWLGALVGVFVGLPLMVLCAIAAGAGHGLYTPLVACFPYAMLLAIQAGYIQLPFLALGLFQFSVYGAVIGWSTTRQKPWRLWLAMAALHSLVAAAALLAAAKEKWFSH